MKRISIVFLAMIAMIAMIAISCNQKSAEDIKKEKKAEMEKIKKDAKAKTDEKKSQKKVGPMDLSPNSDGIYANIKTSKGAMKIKLAHKLAPVTVANFVALAEGKMPNKIKEEGTPYFDGLNFHRVISKHNGDSQDFMIQGGCPLGTGTGNPGYSFQDEFSPYLKHDRPGTLSMANSGPRTNGSQFFVTVAPTYHLDNRHSVFGYVVDGLDVATGGIKKGDEIESITIERIGQEADAWDAMTVFNAKAQRVER